MKIHRLFILFYCTTLFLNTAAQTIHRTVCQGDLNRLDSLLTEAALDTVDSRGRSLLHWAVACQQQETFDFLVDRGIGINSSDHDGATPLHIAVRFKNKVFFDRLINLQDSQDWVNRYGVQLLELAILNKDLFFVEALIEQGVDVKGVNDRGSTPLEISERIHAEEISEWLISHGADKNMVRTFELKGGYLGQGKPGPTPKIFAPNVISTEQSEFGSVFNADGTEFYYGVDVNGKNEIRFSKLFTGRWTMPVTILSHNRYGYNDPFLSPDENRLYFISNRALDGVGDEKEDIDIWYVERTKNGWSEPVNAGANINSDGNEYYISFTKEGTMYFSSNINATDERKRSDLDIYCSKFVDGEFQKPVSLGDSINTPSYEADVYVDPEESYIIFCGIRPEGYGRGDLYISFKNPDGTWTKSVNMGDKINTSGHELCPFVTADGKYFFYTSNQDIYWVDAAIIEDFR